MRKSSDCTAIFTERLSHGEKPARIFGTQALRRASESVQVGEQVLKILSTENLAVAGHIGTAVANDVGDAIVIGGQSASGGDIGAKDAF